MALLRAAGGTPGAREFASLLEACKRSNRAARAARILHVEMAAAGVAPDARAWNALLGAYGRNGDIDGAYATWQVRANFPHLHLLSIPPRAAPVAALPTGPSQSTVHTLGQCLCRKWTITEHLGHFG